MVSLIESWTDEVSHSCIHDGKLLGCALLDIKSLSDERTHLAHYSTTQFEVKLLTIAQLQFLCVCIEIILEIRDWLSVWMIIVNAQSAAHIDVLHNDVMRFKLVLKFVDTVAECLEITHIENLASDVEVQSEELDVLHLGSLFDYGFHVAHGNSELVFCQTCCDVSVRMGADIRIDAETNLRNLILFFSQLVDDFQLRNAFYIEAEDVFLQSEVDFPIAFAYTSVNNLTGRETGFDGCLNFSSAHTVGS